MGDFDGGRGPSVQSKDRRMNGKSVNWKRWMYDQFNCGVQQETNRAASTRILGGHLSSHGKWPWMVRASKSIISFSFVISAFRDFKGQEV